MNKKGSKKNNMIQNLMKDKLLLILVIVLIVLAIFIVSYKIITRNVLDPSDDLVVELHNYFKSSELGVCDGLFTYSDKKVEYSDVDSKTRLCLAYQKADIKDDVETVTYDITDKEDNLCVQDNMTFRKNDDSEGCIVKKIKTNVVDKSYKELFGKEIEDNETFNTDNYNVCYLKDDYYYCGLSEMFTYIIGNEPLIYRIIDQAKKEGSSIVIYDYFVKINNDICYKNYTTSTENKKCTENYNSNKINKKFMNNYGTLYKHTFKETKDGSYYWVSSEPIEE